nr:MAG: hypothetical protein [Bacteriophage sp.]
MTMVHIRLRAPTNGGTRAGVGMVVFQPSARHADDASVVLPDTFTVVLDEEGEATVDIQPTGPDWCWKTDEQVPYGSIRWFTVPDTAGTLEYAELTDVDPRTFKPGRNLRMAGRHRRHQNHDRQHAPVPHRARLPDHRRQAG